MGDQKKFRIPKIHHLIRYFVPLGMLIFFGYIFHLHQTVFLILIGPAIYLADFVRKTVSSFISIPSTEAVNQFGFLLPLAAFYFGVLGFLFKQLWNERGIVRLLSLIALIFFLALIHFMAWKNLLAYYRPIA